MRIAQEYSLLPFNKGDKDFSCFSYRPWISPYNTTTTKKKTNSQIGQKQPKIL